MMRHHLHMPSYFLGTFTEYPYIKHNRFHTYWLTGYMQSVITASRQYIITALHHYCITSVRQSLSTSDVQYSSQSVVLSVNTAFTQSVLQ